MSLLGSPVWLTAAAGAVLFCASLMFLIGGYVGVMRTRTGATVPEGSMKIWTAMYRPSSIQQYLLGAGEGGWHAYRLALGWDIVFSVVFGGLGLVLIDGLWGAADGVSRGLVVAVDLTPIAAAAVDVVEDVLLLVGIGSHRIPAEQGLPRPAAITTAVWVTRAKFVLYAVAVVALLSGAVVLIARGSPAGVA